MWVKAQDGTFQNLTDATQIRVELMDDNLSETEAHWSIIADFHNRPVGFQTATLATNLPRSVADRECQAITQKMGMYSIVYRTEDTYKR